MKKILTMLSAILILVLAGAGAGWAYPVLLIYGSSEVLYDSDMTTPLTSGSIVQLIWSPDATINPPSVYNGRPTGNDVLWETTTIGADGRFSDSFNYESTLWQPGYIYVRFFNAPSWPNVTYYGNSPVHPLNDFFGFELFDITQGELFLYTAYPFMIIPEPETWLTLLPGLALAAFVFRKKKREREGKNPTTRRKV